MNLPFSRWDMLAIGGVGMSALAKVLNHFGGVVSGSDRHFGPEIVRLRNRGIAVRIGHDQDIPEGTEAVVYSSAIPPKNPEIWNARRRGVRIFHRAEILADIMHGSTSIGITGTHGKTTTSACISHILHSLGERPTCLVGGDMRNVGDNVILGAPDLIVSEVDESDQTQELIRADVTVVTNIEADHLDQYGDLNGLERSFERFFMGLADRDVIISGEDARLSAMARRIPLDHSMTFGFDPRFDCAGSDLEMGAQRSSFTLLLNGHKIGRVSAAVPGQHNAANILAAIAATVALGLRPKDIMHAVETFKGTGRRLEVLYDCADLAIVDDYAHHPTEVAAGISSLKRWARPLTIVYQPHRYSRTKLMGKAFDSCFLGADRVFITDIYAADELNAAPTGPETILNAVRGGGCPEAEYLPYGDINAHLEKNRIPGEVIAFLGAGDIGETARAFVERNTQVAV